MTKLDFQNLKRISIHLIPFVLFLIGFTVNMIYAGIGYMPLDQSIVFDGAWRILQGQTPYLDFYLPNGLVPIYLQSLFFYILKPSYLTYCLHSSIFNGLFAILSYFFLLTFLKNRTSSFLYSLATSFIFIRQWVRLTTTNTPFSYACNLAYHLTAQLFHF